jgi:arylsulfatase A
MFQRTLLAALSLVAFAAVSPAPLSAADKPNILFILTDDQGWTTLSSYGNTHIQTPNIDRLAKQGMRFTDAYATPQCTPTRATLLTGQHTARNKLWHVLRWYGVPWGRVSEPPFAEDLSRDTFNLAKGLKAAGYTTASIGKWHLNSNADGDYVKLNPAAAPFYGFDYVAPGRPKDGPKDKDVPRLTDQAISFIEKNRDRPFFCLLTHHTVHHALEAPDEIIARYRGEGFPSEGENNATFMGMLEQLDSHTGRLLAKLDELKLTDKTIVVFMSDNGGVYEMMDFHLEPGKNPQLKKRETLFSNYPLRAGKGSIYEGGIRVPLIVRWPGVIKPASVSSAPVHIVDFLPTLFEAAGATAPATHTLDGVSLVPIFRGEPFAPHPIFTYAPLYDLRWGATPAAAVREGNYKLIEFFGDRFDADWTYHAGHRVELYRLDTDPGETIDLARKESQRAKDMLKRLHAFIADAGATIPGPNPRFDPARQFEETKDKSALSAKP